VRRLPGVKLVTLALAFALAVAGLSLSAPAAQAAASDTPGETWITNGDVYAVTQANGRIYLGGTFDQVGPATGSGVRLDPATGASLGWPKVNGPVDVAVPDGSGGWYIGGDFTNVTDSIKTYSRQNAARILADGTVGQWNPNTDFPVRSIVLWWGATSATSYAFIAGDFTVLRQTTSPVPAYGVASTRLDTGSPVWGLSAPMVPAVASVSALALSADGSRLYAGGSFTNLGGVARSRMAALDAATGTVDTGYNPAPDGAVNALALSPDGRLFVGGDFTHIAAAAQARLAALASTGTADPSWQPGADGSVGALTLTRDGSRLYAGGSFSTIGGHARSRIAALSTTGAGSVDLTFDPGASDAVSGLGLNADGSRLYAAGSFTTIGGNGRRYLAALNAASGAVDPAFDVRAGAPANTVAVSNAGLLAGGDFTSVNGVPRANLAALDATTGALDLGFVADADKEVEAIVADGSSIYVGGIFTLINGQSRTRVAKLDAGTGAVNPAFRASISAEVKSLLLSGNRLFVGGTFVTIDSQTRNHLASLNAATGALDGWDPNLDTAVYDMRLSPDQSLVYVAGDFSSVGGQPRQRLAAISAVTGAPTSWHPLPGAALRRVRVSADGTRVFVAVAGGDKPGNRVQSYRTDSSAPPVWDLKGDGDFQALDLSGSLVYAGGHFNAVAGQARQHLVALDQATGAMQAWNPTVGGVHGVIDLQVTSDSILVAGEFHKVSSAVAQGIARFATSGDPPPSTTTTAPGATTTTTAPGATTTTTTSPGPTTTTTTTTAPPTTTTTAPLGVGHASAASGYWMVGADGAVYPFGDARSYGNATPPAGVDAVDLEPTPAGLGYWVVDGQGTVYPLGDAARLGSVSRGSLASGEQATSLSGTPSGRGYWIFTSRGRVLPFGDAISYGDMSAIRLNGPVLDSIPTPSGRGYYMVASDGGIFAFGDARFYGSMGNKKLNAPVQSLVPDGDGIGYWLVASDGGIFAFEAPFKGSMGGTRLNKPVTGMVRFGDGYLMVAEDGGIFDFSSYPFYGSLGGHPPARPIVSVAALD
jgi:trimeric autotransporter adhesin